MICKICNNDIPNKNIASHVRSHDLTPQEYYDKYIATEIGGICKNCGKETSFLSICKGYRLFCSKQCCNASDYHKQRMMSTIIKNHGGMGTASKDINDKIKKTNMERYGAENVYASDYGKQKIREVSLEKYGVDYVLQSPIVKNKIVQTSLDRYNTSNPGNCRSGRQKAAFTRRANNNDSSWEDYFEQQLTIFNISYIKRYKDTRYPYYCDFYLPDTDTFIEINGYWSHGGHWFDNNNIEDQQKLSIWIDKANAGHKQYKNAINVWTNKDIKKRDIAIKNNLNYIVLWKFDDLIDFFKQYELK